MFEVIKEPWPWYIAGPLIAIVYFLLRYFGKTFGVSSTLRDICSATGCGKNIAFFDYDFRSSMWNLLFVAGGLTGGIIASQFLMNNDTVAIAEATKADLKSLGIKDPGEDYIPQSIFAVEHLFTWKALVFYIAGGFLIGFGTRYGGGCTSGHGITGLSEFQLPSLIAVIGFFAGGLITTHLIFPLIF